MNLPPGADLKWDGCNDNVAVGVRFAEEFTDDPWKSEDAQQPQQLSKRAMTNIHNNAVGRKVRSS
jgi:wnt family